MAYRIVPTSDISLVKSLDVIVMHDAADKWPSKKDTFWLVRDSAGEPVGYCSVRPAMYSPKEHAFLSRVGILPTHRGLGLQRRMIRVRLAWARRRGFTHAVTYAHVTNTASLRNLIREGFLPFLPGMRGDPEPEAWAGWDSLYLEKVL